MRRTWLGLMASDGFHSVGCVCSEDSIDPGSQVLVSEDEKYRKVMKGSAIWWDIERKAWEVHIHEMDEVCLVSHQNLKLQSACPAGVPLCACPCWPAGRGVLPVSLGGRCSVKMAMNTCSGPSEAPVGYPFLHGSEFLPFDSILTRLVAVLSFLGHIFCVYLTNRGENSLKVRIFLSHEIFDN
eukprot:TRINITY_DN45514_c0_g1_i1.p1 TRINITY_DN45514_c0_g1~~TRINITY_DN45514_c0_g1_i1.p1  ORF type:complete len:183 (+),score=7.07 TRINITY_DN45514_c0_g1_i1:143-691(+)